MNILEFRQLRRTEVHENGVGARCYARPERVSFDYGMNAVEEIVSGNHSNEQKWTIEKHQVYYPNN